MSDVSDVLPQEGKWVEQGLWSAQMCVLFITAREKPASATAARCFACNCSSVLEETILLLWFHIKGSSATTCLLSSLAHCTSLFLWLGGANCTSERCHENDLSRAPEHNLGRFRLKSIQQQHQHWQMNDVHVAMAHSSEMLKARSSNYTVM